MTKSRKLIMLISATVMLISTLLPWLYVHTEGDFGGGGGFSFSGGVDSGAVAGYYIPQTWLIMILSIAAICLSFTQFKFTFVLGIINLVLGVFALFHYPGFSISSSFGGVSQSLNMHVGVYIFFASCLVFIAIASQPIWKRKVNMDKIKSMIIEQPIQINPGTTTAAEAPQLIQQPVYQQPMPAYVEPQQAHHHARSGYPAQKKASLMLL